MIYFTVICYITSTVEMTDEINFIILGIVEAN